MRLNSFGAHLSFPKTSPVILDSPFIVVDVARGSMNKQGTTKRQHYVPQMILRNFSKDSLNTSLIVLATGKRVAAAKINRQCYEDYFYGADQIMENSFSAEEDKIATHLGDLSRTKLEGLPVAVLKDLRRFVHYQKARTRGAAEHISKFVAAIAKSAARGTLQLNPESDIKLKDIDQTEIKLAKAQNESIWIAAKTEPIMFDMAVKFIATDRSPGFVIADHPVVAYNQFAEHHPRLSHYPTSTGLALKGLQLFMPLSSSVTLAIYDPSTYEYGGKSRICRAGPQDVRFLNEMQAINAWECIFFNQDRLDEGTLEKLALARERHPSRYKKEVAESNLTKRADGRISQFVVANDIDVRVGAKLSFVRTLDGHSYDNYEGPSVPIRSPELMKLANDYGQKLEEEAERRKKSSVDQ
jgi:hypothetical protein